MTFKDLNKSELAAVLTEELPPVSACSCLRGTGQNGFYGPAAGLWTPSISGDRLVGWERQTSVCWIKDHKQVKLNGSTLTTHGSLSNLPSK